MSYSGYVVVNKGDDTSIPTYIPPPPIVSDNIGIFLTETPIEPIETPVEYTLTVSDDFVTDKKDMFEEYIESNCQGFSGDQRLTNAMNGI